MQCSLYCKLDRGVNRVLVPPGYAATPWGRLGGLYSNRICFEITGYILTGNPDLTVTRGNPVSSKRPSDCASMMCSSLPTRGVRSLLYDPTRLRTGIRIR